MIFWYYRTILGNRNYENYIINPFNSGVDKSADMLSIHISLLQDQLIHKLECLRHHLKRNYEGELFVNENGTSDHVDCINHCLLFAFGECMQQHSSRCQECDKFFALFKDLIKQLDVIHHSKLLEYQEQLTC